MNNQASMPDMNTDDDYMNEGYETSYSLRKVPNQWSLRNAAEYSHALGLEIKKLPDVIVIVDFHQSNESVKIEFLDGRIKTLISGFMRLMTDELDYEYSVKDIASILFQHLECHYYQYQIKEGKQYKRKNVEYIEWRDCC